MKTSARRSQTYFSLIWLISSYSGKLTALPALPWATSRTKTQSATSWPRPRFALIKKSTRKPLTLLIPCWSRIPTTRRPGSLEDTLISWWRTCSIPKSPTLTHSELRLQARLNWRTTFLRFVSASFTRCADRGKIPRPSSLRFAKTACKRRPGSILVFRLLDWMSCRLLRTPSVKPTSLTIRTHSHGLWTLSCVWSMVNNACNKLDSAWTKPSD